MHLQADSESGITINMPSAYSHSDLCVKPKSLRASSRGLFSPLMNYIDKTNPQEFKLTDDIRNTFTNSK